MRVKLAKVLLDFGDRVQYSVFEAALDKKLFDKLVKRVNNDPRERACLRGQGRVYFVILFIFQ